MKEKLLSGRLWLTIITGLVFAYAVYIKLLSGEVVASIVTMVFQGYFLRADRKGSDTNGK